MSSPAAAPFAGTPPPAGATGPVTAAVTVTFGKGGFQGELPNGVADLDLIGCNEQPSKFNPSKTQLCWLFAVPGQEDKGELWYFTSKSMHEKSNLPVVLAATKTPLPTEANPALDIPAIVARKPRVKGYIENKQPAGAARPYARIKMLLP
jgi:hypothetical protein